MGDASWALPRDAADRLSAGRGEIVADILAALERSGGQLRREQTDQRYLEASIRSNTDSTLDMLSLGVPIEDISVPVGAIAYARKFAQWHYPVHGLMRAYMIAERTLLRHSLRVYRSLELTPAELVLATEFTQERASAYNDRVCEVLLGVHESESRQSQHSTAGVTRSRTAEVLDDPRIARSDAEDMLGVRLDRWHLGLILWSDPGAGSEPFREIGEAVAHSLGGSAFEVRVDTETVWLWISWDDRPEVDVDVVHAHVEDHPSVRVALGEAAHGITGFRESHRQALRAHRIARMGSASGRQQLTTYRSVALSALVSDRVDDVNDWIRLVLGNLLRNDENTIRLRETARIFLESGGNYNETSVRVGVHRNTIRNRLAQIEDVLGRSLAEDRLNTEAALQICEQLGLARNAALLTPRPFSPPD